eukprot:TRINITY_DN9447_c0_g1_i2.p1 TRINITY_DN9447_c0_g1~~TRINITY_DN9447_c0_g1_i2.p1  ORF type:complete len:205 (-),score=31.43 TRINITY_DN9447_c0_g1_i2:54-668(-)
MQVFTDLQADNPQASLSFSAPSLNPHTVETVNVSCRLLIDGSSEPKIPLLVDITANLCRDLIGKTGLDAGSAPPVGSQFQLSKPLSPGLARMAISPISSIAGKANRMQKENLECIRSGKPRKEKSSFSDPEMTPNSKFLPPGQSQSLSDQNVLSENAVSISTILNSLDLFAIASKSTSCVVITSQHKSKRERGKGGTDPPRTRQ